MITPRLFGGLDRPAHLLAEPDDERTLCGLPHTNRNPNYPIVLDRFADAHHTAWGLELCPDCTALRTG